MVADFGFRRRSDRGSADPSWDGAEPEYPVNLDAPGVALERRAQVVTREGQYERDDTVVDSLLDAVLDALS